MYVVYKDASFRSYKRINIGNEPETPKIEYTEVILENWGIEFGLHLYMDCAENSNVEWGMDGKEIEEIKCYEFSSHELYLTQF